MSASRLATANPFDVALAATGRASPLDRARDLARRPPAVEQVARQIDAWGLEREVRADWPVLPESAAERLKFCGPLTLPEPVHPVDPELLIINPTLAAAGPRALASEDGFHAWCGAVNRRRRALAAAWVAGGLWFPDDFRLMSMRAELRARLAALAGSFWVEGGQERPIDRQIDALEAMLLSLQAYAACFDDEA